jgi:hypothetical protein
MVRAEDVLRPDNVAIEAIAGRVGIVRRAEVGLLAA